MKRIIFFLSIILSANQVVLCQNNLIPYDSTNYKYIADTLFNELGMYFGLADEDGILNIHDTIVEQMYDYERIKECPCLKENENNLISYKSSSYFIKENKCLALFMENNKYKIRTGTLIKENKRGNYEYVFKEKNIEEEKAINLVRLITKEVNRREVPSYDGFLIACDGIEYVFGNEITKEYGVKDNLIGSESISHLIKMLDKMIRKNN